MIRRTFLTFLLIPVLAGCGAGTGTDSTVGPAVFRGASPVTHSLSADGSEYEVTVSFNRLRATFRGGVSVLLRSRTNPGMVLTATTLGTQTGIPDDDQYTVALFNNPSVGEYYLEATDVNGASIVTDGAGQRLPVRIVE